MPGHYPKMKDYIQNEMSTEVVINALTAFKKHNPNIFILIYGGEPLLRKDLPEIINFCNENEIYYTIISNNTPEIQPLMKRLFEETDYVEGFTSSVDPLLNYSGTGVGKDRIRKSVEGMKRLKEIQEKGDVKDVVAEITVMNENKDLLYDLVSELSAHKIYSDVTFVDIAKNEYYDFSNITDSSQLVKPTLKLAKSLNAMLDDPELYIHMKDVLFPLMFETLPSEYDCGLERGIHNVTVDADGSMRTCLRIRGMASPQIHVSSIFEDDYVRVAGEFYHSICYDKMNYCQLCNHSCLMMSQHIDKHGDGENDLVHTDKRED